MAGVIVALFTIQLRLEKAEELLRRSRAEGDECMRSFTPQHDDQPCDEINAFLAESICPECGGSGQVQVVRDIVRSAPCMDCDMRGCWRCSGGEIPVQDQEVIVDGCPTCGGYGRIEARA